MLFSLEELQKMHSCVQKQLDSAPLPLSLSQPTLLPVSPLHYALSIKAIMPLLSIYLLLLLLNYYFLNANAARCSNHTIRYAMVKIMSVHV